MIGLPPPRRSFYAHTDSGGKKIKLVFARDLWNDSRPSPPDPTTSPPEATASAPKLTLKLKLNTGGKRKRTRSLFETADEPPAKTAKRSPKQRKQCKVKVTCFQYGGPDAKMRGKYENMITLLEPCLQPTCTNCWKWHAHLMRDNDSPTDSDGTDSHKLPRQRLAVELKFRTDEGRARFKGLVHEQTRKDIKAEHDRLRRMQKEITRDLRQYVTGDDVKRKPRRRHRVKLVFKSKKGKDRYRRLVKKYSQQSK